MPRAKKPVNKSRSNRAEKITLDANTIEQLVQCVGIQGNETAIKEMTGFTESWLGMYFDMLKNDDAIPSIGQQIKAIEDIQKSTRSLFEAVRDLQLDTRILLFSDKNSDVTTEWINDREALIKLYQRCGSALKNLRPKKTRGRRKNNALRMTMPGLRGIFDKHNQKTIKDYRNFISIALSAAGIAHPDPDDQRTEFDSLLK